MAGVAAHVGLMLVAAGCGIHKGRHSWRGHVGLSKPLACGLRDQRVGQGLKVIPRWWLPTSIPTLGTCTKGQAVKKQPSGGSTQHEQGLNPIWTRGPRCHHMVCDDWLECLNGHDVAVEIGELELRGAIDHRGGRACSAT